jgi:hypothetical protein
MVSHDHGSLSLSLEFCNPFNGPYWVRTTVEQITKENKMLNSPLTAGS